MTSANVVKYKICDLQGNVVGKHSQHTYCKVKWDILTQFQPYENYTIQSWGLDENEKEWYGDIHNLRDFI